MGLNEVTIELLVDQIIPDPNEAERTHITKWAETTKKYILEAMSNNRHEVTIWSPNIPEIVLTTLIKKKYNVTPKINKVGDTEGYNIKW